METQLPLKLEIGPTSLTVGEILDLSPGDVIVFEHKCEHDVDLKVANSAKFGAEMGIIGVKKGALIKKIYEEGGSVEENNTQRRT